MQFAQILLSSFQQLLTHPLRTILTLSGIAIGVASLLSMVGIGEGTRRQVIADMERLGGTGLLIVETPRPRQESAMQGELNQQLFLDRRDVHTFKTISRHIKHVAPVIVSPVQLARGDKSSQGQLIGSTPEYANMRGWQVARGRFFVDSDLDCQRKVCVIGAEHNSALFKQSDAIGQHIKIGHELYTVVGIMVNRDFEAGRWMNQLAMIPITTFERRLVQSGRYTRILIKADATQSVPIVRSQIRRMLINHYGPKLLFKIQSQAEVIESVNQSTMLLRLSLGVSAMIVLLVGGIGIMNLMLVSVTERTREIGLRKALGATSQNILSQFLAEAVIISIIGGSIGIIAGLVMAQVSASFIALFLNHTIQSVISLQAILVASVFIFLVGIFFGLYPAIRAARLDPSMALSYE